MTRGGESSPGVGRTRVRALVAAASACVMLALPATAALAAIIQCRTGLSCYGTAQTDRLLGTAGQNFMYGRGQGDRLIGYAGSDYLYGGGGDDTLSGGPSANGTADFLYGGPGDDILNGNEDRDVYTFEGDAWGHDTVNDPDAAGLVQFTGMGTALRIDLSPSATAPEASNTDGTATVQWSGTVNEVNDLSTGDDTITGNSLNNRITAAGGFDTVRGASGGDAIDVADGSGGDFVDCGPDTDAVVYDGPTQFSLGDNVTNCENRSPR